MPLITKFSHCDGGNEPLTLKVTMSRVEDKRAPVNHMITPVEAALPSQQASQLSLKSTSHTTPPTDRTSPTADYLRQAEEARLSQEGWEGAAGRAGDQH